MRSADRPGVGRRSRCVLLDRRLVAGVGQRVGVAAGRLHDLRRLQDVLALLHLLIGRGDVLHRLRAAEHALGEGAEVAA